MSPWSTSVGRWGLAFAGVWLVTLVGLRLAVVPPEVCDPPDSVDIDASIAAARDWLVVNQAADGRWLYEYDLATDEAVDDYNLVRHAGVILSLAQLAAAGDPSGLTAAEAGLAYVTDGRLVDAGPGVAVAEPGARVDAGTSGLLAAGLTYWRDATGDTSRDELIVDLARFLAGQVEADGAVLARWDPATGEPVPDQYSEYYTGEAWWALTRVHERFPEEGFDEVAWRIADHVALVRDDEEAYFPPLDDHWAAYALAEMADWGLDDHHLDYAARLAALWSPEVRFDAQRTGEGLNRLFRGATNRGAQHGTNLEGMTSLARLAAADEGLDELRPRLHDRIGCAAGMLVERQYTEADVEAHPAPERVVGGWFLADVTRMDFQQHAMAGLIGAADVLADDRPDPGWARSWGVAAVAAAMVWLLAARRRADELGARAVAVAAVVLGGTALVAPEVLAGLDVSATSFRLAAASVVALTVVGWSAVGPDRRWPVAWRLVEPGSVLVVAWAAADLGRLPALVAVAMALGALVAGGPRRVRWADRAVVALGFATLLGVTGVVGL